MPPMNDVHQRRTLNQPGGGIEQGMVNPHSLLDTQKLFRLPWLDRSDAVRAHHFVIFVFDDVAVPDELAGRVELAAHAGHLSGVGDHGIL
jgi:hypothetical protein